MGRLAAVLGAVLLLHGCVQSQSQTCASGIVCPADKLCDDDHGSCIVEEQRDACRELPDGSTCEAAGARGICDLGVCVLNACGNGVVELGEGCDDGNVEPGDGCSRDCSKLEVCGDLFLDETEQCDDNNTNPADGCDACTIPRWAATALVGGNASALALGVNFPSGIALDRHGNMYVADTGAHRVRRIDANGVVITLAGTGERGFSGDGGPAASAKLSSPFGVAVDGLGNVYIADQQNWRVRRIDPSGTITTIAGNGFPSAGGSAENVPATSVPVGPNAITVDGLGNVFIIDSNRVRRITPAGMISTIAGIATAGYAGDGGPATSAQLRFPQGLALHGGELFIADSSNHRIRRVDASGTITTVAGTGSGGFSGDGGAATSAQLAVPSAVAFDAIGRMYISDEINRRIRRVDTDGTIETFAGTGVRGSAGDGAPALSAQLDAVHALASDGVGLYLCDRAAQRIRYIDTAGTIETRAGSGEIGYTAEGQAATSAFLRYPYGIARDGAGNLYIADTEQYRVRKVTPAGVITTVAGTGQFGYSGDGMAALAAQLNFPADVAVDANGNVFIADTGNDRIRKVDAAGIITTVAGTGVRGFSGDGGAATSAQLNEPYAIAFDASGNLLIADTSNHRIRRVSASGVITTIAGTGVAGLSGDDGAATAAQLRSPRGLAVDAQGLYVADSGNSRIRRIDGAGTITTVAGTTFGYSGDGGAATAAKLDGPTSVAVTAGGELIISDNGNRRLRRVDGTGTISTIAGIAGGDFSGDGGLAIGADLQSPNEVLVDASGRIYVADTDNHHVRVIDGAGRIASIAGRAGPDDMGPVAFARLADPRAFVVSPAFTLFAGGGSGTVQALRTSSAWLENVAGRYPHLDATPGQAKFQSNTFGAVQGVAYDSDAGILYVTEGNQIHAVTVVDAANANTWTIAAYANAANTLGFADGPVATARFRRPTGLLLDAAAKQLYVADTGNHVVRAIDLAAGSVRTVFGVPGTLGFAGDGGAASSGLLYSPSAVAKCANGDFFIADTANHRVRRVAAGTNTITTVLGDGVAGSSGEGAPATSFPVHAPVGLACDSLGNLFVTSTTTVRVVAANASGVVDGTRPVTTIYGKHPRDTFPASATRCLTGIVVIDDRTLQVTDACTGMLIELGREVAP